MSWTAQPRLMECARLPATTAPGEATPKAGRPGFSIGLLFDGATPVVAESPDAAYADAGRHSRRESF